MSVFAKLTAQKSAWKTHGTLASNLGEGMKITPIRNNGKGNYIFINNGVETFSMRVSKKCTAGESARDLIVYESPEGDLILGTGASAEIEWE